MCYRVRPALKIAPDKFVGVLAGRELHNIDFRVYLLLQANHPTWFPAFPAL